MCIRTDTEQAAARIEPDEHRTGPYRRLTDAAVERAKTRLGARGVDDLATKLGLGNRMVLWRARHGFYDIPLSRADAIAKLVGWPLSKVFTEPNPEAGDA